MRLTDSQITELRELASIALSTGSYLDEVSYRLKQADAGGLTGGATGRLQRRLEDAANAHERARDRYAEAAEEYLAPGVVFDLLGQVQRGRRSEPVVPGWSTP